MAGQVSHWRSAWKSTGTARSCTITTSSSSLWDPSVTQSRDVSPGVACVDSHCGLTLCPGRRISHVDLANHGISLIHISPLFLVHERKTGDCVIPLVAHDWISPGVQSALRSEP